MSEAQDQPSDKTLSCSWEGSMLISCKAVTRVRCAWRRVITKADLSRSVPSG